MRSVKAQQHRDKTLLHGVRLHDGEALSEDELHRIEGMNEGQYTREVL